jgi:acyl-CoA dehydrogenase
MTGISFDVDEETQLILNSLDEFIDREVAPLEDDLETEIGNPRLGRRPNGQPTEEVLEAVEEVRRKSGDAGFYGMLMPEEVGGQDVSTVTWYVAKRHVASKGRGLAEHVLKGPEGPNPLLLYAEGEQVERYLEPVVRGEKSTAFAQTEPDVGSDSPAMRTRAERDGDEWIINGRKQWITNAAFCDFALVLARTTPMEEVDRRYEGITCFIVESDEFELGSVNNAIGLEGWQAEIILDDVTVSESRVLGPVDGAFRDAMSLLTMGRLELGAEAVGYSQYLLEQSKEYAQDREAFGQPIGRFQQVSSMYARGRAKTYVADAGGLRCAWNIEQGTDVVEDVSIFHWFATNAFWQIADDAVQIHGANGLSEDNPFVDHLNLARVLRIVEGTDEIQLNTIAKQNGLL